MKFVFSEIQYPGKFDIQPSLASLADLLVMYSITFAVVTRITVAANAKTKT
jgi:hypothetical protein